MFRKILIANRGEIALRILRACRTLGVEAVVAYSEADRDSLPVQLADEAICIGPADARRSYLSAPAVISAALVTGCDAIHPGYGFLSEDEGFAEVVAAHGLTFIGPSADVLERFASKEGTRRAARRATACRRSPARTGMLRDDDARPRRGRADRLPGPDQAVGRRRRQGHAHGPHAARARIGAPGLPLRGEGRLRRRLALPREVARREPPRRGPGRRRPLRPRRPPRRARLLGPAPPPEDPRGGADAGPRPTPPAPTSPSAPSGPSSRPATRTSGRSSSSSTRAGDFYFIEINCRIQVEHPVTEMLTGIDMVATQIRIAAGEPLGFSQADVAFAATPSSSGSTPRTRRTTSGPAPASSSATTRRAARASGWIRTCTAGYEVPPFYDSLLGKLDRLGPGPGDRHRPRPRRPRRARRRGPRHQRRDPPGAARQRDVPRGPDDDEPARPRRQRGLPRRGRAPGTSMHTCTQSAARPGRRRPD